MGSTVAAMHGVGVLGGGEGDLPQLTAGQLLAWVGGPMSCSLVGGAASVKGCTSTGLKRRVLLPPVIRLASWGSGIRWWWLWCC